jgi:hypothetical protein
MIMQKNVICKKCNNLVNGWCEKVIDSPDPDMVRDCRHFSQKTNADRIRAMSDEELAEYLYYGFGLQYCHNYSECAAMLDTEEGIPEARCKGCVLEWLKQPAEG